MDLLNGLARAVFNVLLVPLEAIGPEFSLVITSGIFGILALIAFKHISWQKGIKSTKDKIKGHLIAIRIYQDDLAVVASSVVKILGRNFQYIGLNFGPFVPLAIPFMIVAAQMVTRYGFEPIPVSATPTIALAGQGTMLEVRMAPGHEAEISDLQIGVPDTIELVSPIVRAPSDGRAFVEFVAKGDGAEEFTFTLGDGTTTAKSVVTGDSDVRYMQPERVSSFWSAWLWPAEDTLSDAPAIAHISFAYPERSLAWMPDGPFGVLVALLVASMAFGIAVMKPLGVQI